jgi:hypothetical protein
MAAPAGFKQQCPSCEALVPIRDPRLIGKKIDCPKCKYRFVVEDPASLVEEEDEPKPRPAKKAAPARAGAAKAGPRRRRGEDEDEDRPRPKRKKGGSNTLVLGLGLAGVAVVLLGVGGWLLFNRPSSTGGGGSTPGTPGPGAVADAGAPGDPENPEPPREEAKGGSVTAPGLEVSNLLPNGTDTVINVNVKDLVPSTLGRALFDTPGAFTEESVQQWLGIPLRAIDRVVSAESLKDRWTFTVLRTNKPIPTEAVLHRLGLNQDSAKPPDGPIQGQDYYLMQVNNTWLENLNRLLARVPNSPVKELTVQVPPQSTLAVRFHDAQTLVLAEPNILKDWLQLKGKPEYLTKPGTAAPARPRGGAPDVPGGLGPTDAPAGPVAGPGGVPGPGGSGDIRGGDVDNVPPAVEAPPPPVSNAYLTISPALKDVLDRVETGQTVVSLAVDMQALARTDPKVQAALQLAGPDIKGVNAAGLALHMRNTIFTVNTGASCATETTAYNLNRKLAEQLEPLKTTGTIPGVVKLVVASEPETPNYYGGPGGFYPVQPGGIPGDPDMVRPGVPGGAFTPGYGTPGGFGPGGTPDGYGGFIRPPDPREEKFPVTVTVTPTLRDKALVVKVDVELEHAIHDKFIDEQIRPQVSRLKGALDMAGGLPRRHHLAQTVLRYRDDPRHPHYPRGTVERPTTQERNHRPWGPDQRVSWLAELLPYMGYAPLYSRINMRKSWRDPENLLNATVLVPEFLDNQTSSQTWWARYPGVPHDVAATHFVGVAGVGLDAAEYSDGDPAVAAKLGVFGYNRRAQVKDISDGASNTVMMIQVPPTYQRPWLAGGGSTVQGVPESRSIQPFVSTQHNGKRGTYLLMADGSVRFVTENIADEVFKALCTIKGGEELSPELLRQEAPVVPVPAARAELKTRPPAQPGTQPALPIQPPAGQPETPPAGQPPQP